MLRRTKYDTYDVAIVRHDRQRAKGATFGPLPCLFGLIAAQDAARRPRGAVELGLDTVEEIDRLVLGA